MNAVILLIAAFSLLLPIEDPPSALALRGVTLEGTVVRTDTMLPVPGAVLTFVDAVTGDTLASAQSDNAGAYSTFVSTSISDHPAVPRGFSVGAPYPNPVSDVRHVRVETENFAPHDARIELFDIQGKRVQPGSHLAAGTYLLDVSIPSSKIRHTRSLTLLQPGPIELNAVPSASSNQTPEPFFSAGKRSYGPLLLAHLEAAGLVPHVQQIDLSLGIYRVDFELSPSHTNVALGPEVKIIDVPLNVESSSQQVDIQWAGSPVDGLQLAFPEQAFEGNWTLALSYREVLDHQLDSRFQAISPAISIDTNHRYADHAFRVSVPVSVSADHSALAVLYDQESGRMEVLPPSNGPEGTVSFEARHLYRMPDLASPGKSADIRLDYPGEVIVFEISHADLYGSVRYDTGYTPGADDWEFVNHGSILSPGGICAGQSLTNIWYFLETHRPKLNGLLLEEELADVRFYHSIGMELSANEQGYRMASIAQEEHNWNTALYEYAIRERTADEDRQTFEAFAAAMLLTGEPQVVGLFRSQLGGGHAIVAHTVDLVDFKLYVNDPNFPGQERFIQWTQTGFQPYSSKLKADDPDERAFDRISFSARSALTDWPSLSTLWNDVWHDRAGNTERYTWPEYELQQLVLDEWIPLDETLYGDRDDVAIRAVCPDCHDMGLDLARTDDSPDWLGFSLFDASGSRFLENANCPSNSNCFLDIYTEMSLPAEPEVRHFGLWGLVIEEEKVPSPTWVGFRTLEVASPVWTGAFAENGTPLPSNEGTLGESYSVVISPPSFIGQTSNLRVDWSIYPPVGDVVSVSTSAATVDHQFDQEGTWLVSARIYEGDRGLPLGYLPMQTFRITNPLESTQHTFNFVITDSPSIRVDIDLEGTLTGSSPGLTNWTSSYLDFYEHEGRTLFRQVIGSNSEVAHFNGSAKFGTPITVDIRFSPTAGSQTFATWFGTSTWDPPDIADVGLWKYVGFDDELTNVEVTEDNGDILIHIEHELTQGSLALEIPITYRITSSYSDGTVTVDDNPRPEVLQIWVLGLQ